MAIGKNKHPESKGLWNIEKVLTYFEDPSDLLRKHADIQAWIVQHGGLEGIDTFLRKQRLPLKDQELLDLLLEYPMEPHDFYFKKLNIVNTTFYRRRRGLAERLVVYLNIWCSNQDINLTKKNNDDLDTIQDISIFSRAETIPTNVPIPTTPLFGREQAITDIIGLLQDTQIRQITLTGPGGVGKTRLALQVGSAAQSYFPDGVWFISLAAITNSNIIPDTIAQVLGIKDATTSVLNQLKIYLRDRSLLLILDNLEQVIAVAPIIDEILSIASQVKILVTSRILLHNTHEQEVVVSPLELPNQHRIPSLPVLAHTAVVQLFLDRARSARSGLVLTQGNASTIIAICRHLDGLPLGIELAAARTRLLSPIDILQRLENRFKLLKGKNLNLPPRQQTMHNAIAWSYDLLEPNERDLFIRLSVFVDGWTTNAAETICLNQDDDILTGLEVLLDSSLIYYQDYDGADAGTRFTMLETIRDFAHECLKHRDEQQQEYQLRHLKYFHAYAKQAEPRLTADDQVDWLARLEQDSNNIRAALEYSLQIAQPAYALEMASALWHFWLMGGHITEGRRWLDTALSQSEDVPITVKAKALFVNGNLALNQFDHESGCQSLTQCLSLSRQINDVALIAKALRNLGKSLMAQGSYQEAIPLIEESLMLFRTLPDASWDIAWTLNTLGIILAEENNNARALVVYEEALSLLRRIGDRHGISWCLTSIADLMYKEGRYDRAEILYLECLQLRRLLGDKSGCAWALNALGNIAFKRENYSQIHFLEESLILYYELEHFNGMVSNLLVLAKIFQKKEDYIKASKIIGSITTCVEQKKVNFTPDEASDYEEFKQSMDTVINDLGLASCWVDGKLMTMEDIIHLITVKPIIK